MLARLARGLLIATILLAQQTALAHQYGHALSSPAQSEAPKPQKGDALCSLHDLLGTVLAIASAAAPAAQLLALSEPGFIAGHSAVREAARLSRHSRDPPLIS